MKSLILITVIAIVSVGLFSNSVQAQQTDRDLYISLYKTAQYDKALILLKRVTKQNPTDAVALYYLGLTNLGAGNEKDAVKALKRAVGLKSDDANILSALAYAYMLRNDSKAAGMAEQTLRLAPMNAGAYYVLAVVSLRHDDLSDAVERSTKVIEIDPNFASAYLVRSQSLVSSFAVQSGTGHSPKEFRHKLLADAVSDLEKYIALRPNNPEITIQRNSLDSLKFFAEYYGRPDNQAPAGGEPLTNAGGSRTPLKILSKPHANYTDRARQANVSGSVRLLVGLAADGTIKHILIVKSLGYGLDERSIEAARQIKFEPPTKDGKPVSTVVTFEYGFLIY